MLDAGVIWGLALLLATIVVASYLLAFRRQQRRDRERKAEAAALGIDRPTAQYPYIDASRCIGCGVCVAACPEGDPLGIVLGTAVVINGLRCVGHGRCEKACPVGAIEVGLGDLKSRADVPLLDDDFQTSVEGIFVAGELGGLALVKNACLQGKQAVEAIARTARGEGDAEVLDLAIVGAGPAGLAAGLTAASKRMRYAVLERETNLGGSLLHYPRRKMVLTQPVELPPWGALDREEYSKEELVELFERMVRDVDLSVRFDRAVQEVRREDGHFLLEAGPDTLRARRVLLCLGRRGTPRKLGVPGEELPKVMYRLIDAASYQSRRILVVGGGDSAVEATIGLARQKGNQVTLSYRKEKLFRIKKKNEDTIARLFEKGFVRPLFNTNVTRIGEEIVTLQGEDGELELENDYIFIFAGGVPPFRFLEKIGIRFGGSQSAA